MLIRNSSYIFRRFGSQVLLGCWVLGGAASGTAQDAALEAAEPEEITVDATKDVPVAPVAQTSGDAAEEAPVEATAGTTVDVAQEAAVDAPLQATAGAMQVNAVADAAVDTAQDVPLDTAQLPTTDTAADSAAAEKPTSTEQRYLDAVSSTESTGGAYDPALSQQLLGLGISYQSEGKHAEAAEVLNRAAHVTRVNEGLYSTADLPILELLIESYAALGEWEEVGNRYHQMFQIHHRNYGDNDPRLLPMLDKLSTWHMRAYLQDLGEQPLNHLMTARNLNDSSATIMRSSYPANDPRIADKLRQRALVDYYLASYRPPDIPETGFGNEDEAVFTRQPNYLINSFSDGRDALSGAVEIHKQNPDSTSLQRSEAVAELGDWHQLFNRTQTALDTYREAYAEGMLGGDHSASNIDRVFGKPRALPVLPQDYELPADPANPPDAYILLSFDVDENGQAEDFQVLESVPSAADKSVAKLRKQLRATRFRPRFADGEPAATSGLTYRYLYQP